jgi:hypothetical protein
MDSLASDDDGAARNSTPITPAALTEFFHTFVEPLRRPSTARRLFTDFAAILN